MFAYKKGKQVHLFTNSQSKIVSKHLKAKTVNCIPVDSVGGCATHWRCALHTGLCATHWVLLASVKIHRRYALSCALRTQLGHYALSHSTIFFCIHATRSYLIVSKSASRCFMTVQSNLKLFIVCLRRNVMYWV